VCTKNDDPSAPVSFGFDSRDGAIVAVYLKVAVEFLECFEKPDVVDLGCGDFNVGSQMRPWWGAARRAMPWLS